MIQIKSVNNIPNIQIYCLYSDKNVKIKRIGTDSEQDYIHVFKMPNVKDYVECSTAIPDEVLKHKYDIRVKQLIHEKYSIDDEIQLMAEKDINAEAWNSYRAFVGECKVQARREIYGKN